MGTLPNSTNARIQAVDLREVNEQVSIMELAVLDAIADSKFMVEVNHEIEVDVNGSTIIGSPMTTNSDLAEQYYYVWQGQVNDAVKKQQMQSVIDYFENLGYAITRYANTAVPSPANQIFYWRITW